MTLHYKDNKAIIDGGDDLLEHGLRTLRDAQQHFQAPFTLQDCDHTQWRRAADAFTNEEHVFDAPNAASPHITALRNAMKILLQTDLQYSPADSTLAWSVLERTIKTTTALKHLITFLREGATTSATANTKKMVYTPMKVREHVIPSTEAIASDGSVPRIEEEVFDTRAWSADKFRMFLNTGKEDTHQGIVVRLMKDGIVSHSVGFALFEKSPSVVRVASVGVTPPFRVLGAAEILAVGIIYHLSPKSSKTAPEGFRALEDKIHEEHPKPPHRWAWEPSKHK